MAASLDVAIIIFAYKRRHHFARLLDSLAANQIAKTLPIRVYIDGPRTEDDCHGVFKVNQEASLSRGLEKLRIIQRPTNLGLYASITLGVSETLKDYECAIILEDDLVLSPHCIDYFLKALSLYQDNDYVASIHAWTPSVGSSLPNTFFLKGSDCWGWATWRDKWNLYRHDASNMVRELKARGLIDEFNFSGGYNYYQMLKDRASNLNNSWAICWKASCFLADQLTLHPSKTLVENIGCDNSGENCNPEPALLSELTKERPILEPIPAVQDEKAYAIYCSHFKSFATKPSLKLKLKELFQYLLDGFVSK